MSRFESALDRFDAANAEDPGTEEVDGEPVAKALIYGRRMSAQLTSFRPDASEALKLAARAQHLRRFEVPRDRYPMDRPGYHRWRTDLGKLHAKWAGEIMQDVGYEPEMVARVRDILRKKGLRTDPDVQALEDVACLVFLEHYYGPFIDEKDDEKVVVILRKTWAKMSEKGQAAAARVPLGGRAAALMKRALDEDASS